MFSVRVPATIANLGPGFDSLGVAVGLWLSVSAEVSSTDQFVYEGDGFVAGPDNLIHQGFRAACRAMSVESPKISIEVRNPIPLARGLGSSSAALVAGAALADCMFGKLGRLGVLRVCSKLEGHPDNVAPAVLGGFTTSLMQENSEPQSTHFPLPNSWRMVVAVPDFELKTSQARAALPEQYSRQDAIFNLSRAAMWVAAVATNKPALLREACRDRLHQSQRAALIPGLEAGIEAALAAGADAAFLSGAGPSLAALVASPDKLLSVEMALKAFASRLFVLEFAGGYEIL